MTKNTVRLLTLADLTLFHEIRLKACREEPSAFMESYEELVGQPLENFTRYFDNGWIAGAFADEKLVATSGLFRNKGLKVQHKGTLWCVYVIPEARGNGFARRCMEMVLAEAKRAGIEVVQLAAEAANTQAITLYKSFGFEQWGEEKSAVKLADGRYIDDVSMAKYL